MRKGRREEKREKEYERERTHDISIHTVRAKYPKLFTECCFNESTKVQTLAQLD